MNNTKSHVWVFFGVLYTITCLLYIPIILSGDGITTTLNKILMATVVFVPSLAGVAFIHLTKDQSMRRDFWQRVFRLSHIRPGVIIVSLLIFPSLTILAYITAALLGREPLTFDYAAQLFQQAPVMIEFLLVEFFLGAVSEELGWRGYALDELQSRWNALTSSLILGVIWAFWHTPAFLIPGLSQYEMRGLFSWNYVSFLVAVTAGSVFHTWSYNNSNRSIALSGVLLHFVQNAVLIFLAGIFDAFTMPRLFWPIHACITLIAAATLVYSYGAQTMTGKT